MVELERQYASGAISNAVIAEQQASSYCGIPVEDIVSTLSEIPCIGEIDETILDLRERGIESILGTVTWSVAAEEFRRRHGFAAVSGTEVAVKDGILTGAVKRHFNEWDKLEFVRSHCEANQIELSQCIAVGDSRSDVPLFEAVGFSIALNATAQARDAATVALDSESLTDVLSVIPWE